MCVASTQEVRCSHTWNRKRRAWGELVSGSRLVSARFLHSRGGVTPVSPLCTQGSGGALSPLRKQLRTQRDFVKFDASSSPKPLFFRKAKGSGAATSPGPGLQVPDPRPAAHCPSAPRPTTATRGADRGSVRWPRAPLLASAASRGVPALFRQPFRPRAARGLSGELEVWSVTPFRVSGTGVLCPRSRRTRQRRGDGSSGESGSTDLPGTRGERSERVVVVGEGGHCFRAQEGRASCAGCPGQAAGGASSPRPGDRGPGGALVAGGLSWPAADTPGELTFK